MNVLLSYGSPEQGILTVYVLGLWLLQTIVHIAFAIAVHAHARRRATTFVSPWLWALATLAGGPLVALAYWLMHASSLAGRAGAAQP